MPLDTDDCGLRIADCGLAYVPDNPKSEIRSPKLQTSPLCVLFVQTDMRIGGAEMVTASIIRRLNRSRFAPELCCLKERGAIGEALAEEIPVHHGLLRHKYDLRVWPRLTGLLRRRKIDAVITVGAGDKMLWGRLAAWRAGVPVVVSALHSTGWPDCVGRLNRMLTPLTDAFIAVAGSHGRFLIEHTGFPAKKVVVIPNGVDTQRFAPISDTSTVRGGLGIDANALVVGIVAALRPEKNHKLFLQMAQRVAARRPDARFLIIGDGPCRGQLERRTIELNIASQVQFLGMRDDVPRLLAAMDVFALSSVIEANPMSILEAMSVGRPVVATNVGSIHEAVIEGETGFLVSPGDAAQLTERVLQLLDDPRKRAAMGSLARCEVVERWSVEAMVSGYEQLIDAIYQEKCAAAPAAIARSAVGSR
jgi:glycosyltransferase involved in cell wall biosynthesis